MTFTYFDRSKGFTLAELLIALAILGLIAAFAIPKVLSVQKNGAKQAYAKEVIATFSSAFQQHKLDGLLTSSTRPADLLSRYFNYVSTDTSATVDQHPGSGASTTCSTGTGTCYRLIIRPWNCQLGSTTDPTYAMAVLFDPDGVYTGNDDSVRIIIHSNGKVETEGSATEGTIINCGTPYVYPAMDPTKDPSWFSW